MDCITILSQIQKFVPGHVFEKYRSKLKKSMQQILRELQLNLFEKRDLMTLLRGDPPHDIQLDTNQMALR